MIVISEKGVCVFMGVFECVYVQYLSHVFYSAALYISLVIYYLGNGASSQSYIVLLPVNSESPLIHREGERDRE